jgi:hypothetical protein
MNRRRIQVAGTGSVLGGVGLKKATAKVEITQAASGGDLVIKRSTPRTPVQVQSTCV